jgi:hypothetical protein
MLTPRQTFNENVKTVNPYALACFIYLNSFIFKMAITIHISKLLVLILNISFKMGHSRPVLVCLIQYFKCIFTHGHLFCEANTFMTKTKQDC